MADNDALTLALMNMSRGFVPQQRFDPRMEKAKYAAALSQAGADASPVGHWTQALARAVQGAGGGWLANRVATENEDSLKKLTEIAGMSNPDPAKLAAAAVSAGFPEMGANFALTAALLNRQQQRAGQVNDVLRGDGTQPPAPNTAPAGPAANPTLDPNNIGNIKDMEKGGFRSYPDSVTGVAATNNNLLAHYNQLGAKTFAQLARTWLGGKADGPDIKQPGADSKAWATAVAQAANLDPNAPLPVNDPQAMAKVMRGINIIEHGRPTVPDEAYLAGVTGGRPPVQPTQATPVPAPVVAQAAPQAPSGPPAIAPQRPAGAPPAAVAPQPAPVPQAPPAASPAPQAGPPTTTALPIPGQSANPHTANAALLRRQADQFHGLGRQEEEKAALTAAQAEDAKAREWESKSPAERQLAMNEELRKQQEAQRQAQKPALSAEAAKVKGLVESGLSGVNDMERMLFDEKGKLRSDLILQQNLPAWLDGPQGKNLRTAAYWAADAELRLKTGAQAPASEIQRQADALMPGVRDDEQSVRYKIQQLRAYLSGVQKDLTSPNIQSNVGQPAAPNAPRETSPAMPKPGDVMDGYRFKGGNPADRNSWERAP